MDVSTPETNERSTPGSDSEVPSLQFPTASNHSPADLSPKHNTIAKRPSASTPKSEANRRNAQRSTGPKSARGKANSRRNALKHGFLAKELLITGGEGMESRAEFEQLLLKTRDYFQPVGTPEELLVDQIVAAYWRLRRLHQHEVGEIRSRLDDASTVLTNEKLQRLEQCRSTLALQQKLATSDSKVSLLRGMAPVELDIIRQKFLACTNGIDFLLQLLANASEEIAKTGSASVDLRWQLCLYFGFADPGIAHLSRMRSSESCQQPHSLHGAEATASSYLSSPTDMLARIDTEKNALLLRRAAVAQTEESARGANLNRLRLPDAAPLQRIVQYESHIQRQLARAYAQLERLQRLRGGEDLPPPLTARLELG